MLGKRKRDSLKVSRRTEDPAKIQSDQIPTSNAEDIFRYHFETRFGPLPKETALNQAAESALDTNSSDGESETSEWSGLSESSNHVSVVEVVESLPTEKEGTDESHRSRHKAFIVRLIRLAKLLENVLTEKQSSRPPREIPSSNETKHVKPQDEDDPVEKLNLKHDLDLQRLLKESHLLEKSKGSDNPGKLRQRAIDMRLQTLGVKESTFTQQRMPLAHRTGITKKADQKEARRRKDAKENGVILEKATKKATKGKYRDRGVDVPGVGKFAGGTLKLSRRDVASIQGPPSAARKGKRR